MDIIDFHAHIYPEKIAAKATESIGAFYTLPIREMGTARDLLVCAKAAGIRRTVIHSPALLPRTVHAINCFIGEECRSHPEFIGFGTLHAFMENPEAEIEEILALGLKGVKIHPDIQAFDLDHEKMLPIYRRLEQLGLPVLFHTGDYRYDYSHPRRLVRVLNHCPNLVCIGAHFGGWSIFDLAAEYLKDSPCYLDISSSMAFLGAARSRELISLYGPRRMLFGSDFPMWSPKKELEVFLSLGLSPEENQLILHDNAAKILGIA